MISYNGEFFMVCLVEKIVIAFEFCLRAVLGPTITDQQMKLEERKIP